MSNPEYVTIGQQFLSAYFGGNGKDHFSKFYGNDSILSVENEKFNGANDISDKLSTVEAEYKVTFHEIQPSNNGILIFLSGQMVLKGESNPINFHRIFFLAPTNSGSIYVKNDMYLITFG